MEESNLLKKVVIITGPSGAGKTTVINSFQDIGYETIDNIPIDLIGRLLARSDLNQALAIGIDIRTISFSSSSLIQAMDGWKENNSLDLTMLYLDCSRVELQLRFNQTRRPHPLSIDAELIEAIIREEKIMEPIREISDLVINTSCLSPSELRNKILHEFYSFSKKSMVLSLNSFSYRHAMPVGLDMVFDCRFLKNPYWVAELRDFDGRAEEIKQFIEKDQNWDNFFDKITKLSNFLLPIFKKDRRSYFTIGFGCTGGKHRSVFTTEALAKFLAANDWELSVRHLELEKETDKLI